MDYHQNARLTPYSREQMCCRVVGQGLTLKMAAPSFNVIAKTAAKWVRRYRALSVNGLPDCAAIAPFHRGPPRYRQVGAESVHVAIDDHTSIAFSALYPDESSPSVLHFLEAALMYSARLRIRFRAVLTDNGVSYRSYTVANACRALALKRRRARPYTPRTNGKAECFLQSALREWAYARNYHNSAEQEQHLAPWIHPYNWHRPHASLGLSTPKQQSRLRSKNLLRLHT